MKKLTVSGVNPDCEACGGEGFCEYAMGEDSYPDYCDVCFPNGYDPGDQDYDAWRDDQIRDDIEA